jgi:ferrochelatase
VTAGLVVMAYGTPAAPDEVEAYYTHIRRGRPPAPEQLADLQRRYDAIGGVSPLAERTRGWVDALDAALDGEWRVSLGYKHAPPFIEDALAALTSPAHGGPVERVIGLVLAPHYSRGSVGEYHARASAAAAEQGLRYRGIESWHSLPQWIDAQAARVRSALGGMPGRTAVLFTAHSLPERVLDGDPYAAELQASAAAIAAAAGLRSQAEPATVGPGQWALAWQSAGRTPEAWRGPDVTEVIRGLGKTALDGVLVCPQGFVSDHLEVLYDLDIDTRRVAEEAGLTFGRTSSIDGEHSVMAALADLVRTA